MTACSRESCMQRPHAGRSLGPCRNKRLSNLACPNRRYIPSPKGHFTFHDRRLPFLIHPTIVDRRLQNGPQPLSKMSTHTRRVRSTFFEHHLCCISSLCQRTVCLMCHEEICTACAYHTVTHPTRLFCLLYSSGASSYSNLAFSPCR